MTEQTFRRAQWYVVILLAIFIALPYALYAFQEGSSGLVPFRTNDDGFYMGRLDSVLSGHPKEFQNGITGPQPFACGVTHLTTGSRKCRAARGIAPALLELAAGTLFGWTGLHGPQVSVLITVLIAPLMILLLTALLRALRIGRGIALFGSVLYVIVFLSPLERPIYMSLAL